MYSQMMVGMVAFTGQWWLDARKPGLEGDGPGIEEVAANLIQLAWGGLAQLDARGADSRACRVQLAARQGLAAAYQAAEAPGAIVTVFSSGRAVGRPASRQARCPPTTSVARARPRSCSAAAARLDV